jgi:DNA-binding XRE family transcriptional regulator
LSQIAIDENKLMYSDLPENTFAEKIKKAKMLKGLTQEELSKVTGLSRSTINELEADYRDNITRDTLNKLLTILDSNIICDDYLKYILNQENNIKNLISLYGKTKLSDLLKVHRSTIERWANGKYQLPKEKHNLIKELERP